ncbi:MAG: DNA primase [Bacteroidaceae bacterium]|nr:DNA primase [Bacteroidaceae bacterium]
MIDRLTKDKIMEAAEIVDVVSDFVTLKKSGANFKGLCPFHDDRTPSFMVSPSKNYCKCFACGKGGNPVGFIMEHEQLSYPEALRYLARKYGIPVQERELTPEEKAAETERDSMFILNEWAMKWFQEQMYETPDGRAVGLAYFRQRGFRDDIVRKFQLGFCPKGKDTMTQAALKAGYREQFLLSTGLSVKRDDGTMYDRYWGRVMFPWHTVGGKVAGFGGRVLDAATKGVAVKYQNSPESSVYSKRKELYGLFQAKHAINKQDLVYMVEGYTDVLSMHQCGIENVVANSGTALTREQIRLLHRFTDNITLLYDGDDAGIHAAQRGTDMLLAEGMNVRILLLPDGDDPDSFARKHNVKEFRDYVMQHEVDFIRFKTELLLEKAKDDPRRLSELVNDIVLSIAVIPDEITRTFYITQAAQTLQMDEAMIQRAVSRQIVKLRDEEHKRRMTGGQRSESVGIPEDTGTEAVDTAMPGPASDPSDDVVTTNPETAMSSPVAVPTSGVEMLLAQLIVRYGERKICEVEDDKGVSRQLSVAEYISISLTLDGIALRNANASLILDEAMKHVKEDDFVAERYFLGHENLGLSQLASRLCLDREQLSIYHGKDHTRDEDRLLEITTHILADLKLAIVRGDIKDIMKRMKDAELSKEQHMELLRRFKELKEAEARLAKDAGDRVL